MHATCHMIMPHGFFGSAPLCSLASCGRISASVLSTGRPSAAADGSCSGAAIAESAGAMRKVGKKKASSLLARSPSSLPWRPLNRDSVPYWARRLRRREGGWKNKEKTAEEKTRERERRKERGEERQKEKISGLD